MPPHLPEQLNHKGKDGDRNHHPRNDVYHAPFLTGVTKTFRTC